MNKFILLLVAGGGLFPLCSQATDLKQAKLTQVVNMVDIISPSDKSLHHAAINDDFKMPDVLRTGPNSRAELVAADKTITRVGANTVFSFDPASRTIDLQQGSLLFHSPHGKGGGTIRTGSATASVLGTTIIVTTMPNGGFKVLVLEGVAEVKFLHGLHLTLQPGQMTFILPGGGTSPVVVFRLDEETKGSALVNGFTGPLPSQGLINAEITRQLLQILNNSLEDTGLIVGDNATPDAVQVRMDILGSGGPFNNNASIVGQDKNLNDPNPVSYPPLNPNQVEISVALPSGIASFEDGLPFLGITDNPAASFVGDKIDIDTAQVDLSGYAGDPDFEIMAKGDMRIWQSVAFTPPSGGGGGIIIEPVSLASGQPDTIGLLAGGRMLIKPYSTLEADTGIFGLAAGNFGVLDATTGLPDTDYPNTLLDVSIYNNVGGVDILSESDLTIMGMNAGYTVNAGGNVNIESDGDLILGTDGTAGGVSINAVVSVNLRGTGGNVGIYNSDVSSQDMDANGNSVPIAVTIAALNDVDIAGSDISANSANNLNVSGSSIEGSSVDITGTYNNAGGISISAGGDVKLNNSTVNLNGNAVLENDSIYSGLYFYDYNTPGNINISLVSTSSGVFISGNDISINNSTITGGNLSIVDSSLSTYNGDVNIENSGSVSFSANNISEISGSTISLGNISVSGSTLTANFGSVNIESSGSTSFSINNSPDISGSTISLGSISVSGSTLTANGGNISILSDGSVAGTSGSAASAGGILISGSSLDAYGSPSDYPSGGLVNISSVGTVDIENTSINADGDVDIESSGTLTLGSSSGNTITAGGAVNLTSDNGDVDIYNGTSLTANGSDVNIYANYGNVAVENSIISAVGNVDIEAGYDEFKIYPNFVSSIQIITPGTSTLELNGDTITAGGAVSANAPGDATIDGTTLMANNGNVSITADNGNLTMNNSTIQAGNGDAAIQSGGMDIEGTSINAGGNVTARCAFGSMVLGDNSGDTIVAGGGISLVNNSGVVDIYNGTSLIANGGDVDIYTYHYGIGGVDIESSTISASGNVDIEASYLFHYSDSSQTLTIGNDTITAAVLVTLAAPGSVSISGGGITANGGDADITSYNSTVDIENTFISATGSANIEGGSTLTLGSEGGGTITAGDTVLLASANGDANINGFAITATTGDADIYATYGGVNMENSTVSTSGNVDIEAGYDDVNSENSGAEALALDSDTITATGSVTLAAPDSVSISGGGITANGGDVDITSYNSTVDIENTLINASGNVNIESTDTLTLGKSSGNKIEAGGGVSLTSGYGDVDVYGSKVYGNDGDVDVYANFGNLDLESSTIQAAGTVDLEAGYGFPDEYQGSSTLTLNGDSVTASGSVTVAAPGSIFISGGGITANGGDVSISSNYSIDCEDGSINASGNVTISAIGGTMDIGGMDIDADGSSGSGNADIESSDTLTLGKFRSDTIVAYGSIYLSSGYGDTDIYNATSLTADGGDVDIYSYFYGGGNVDVENSTISASGNVDIEAGYLNDGAGSETITLNNNTIIAGGSVTANAPGSVSISNGSITGGSLNVNAGTGLTVSGASLNANTTSGTASLNSTTGQTTINNGSSMQAFYISVNSPDGILLDGTGGTFAGNQLNLASGNTAGTDEIDVHNADLTAFQTVNMAAHTVNLLNVDFGDGSLVNLHSFYGVLADNPNTGAVSVPGDVNFINGVTYAGTLITSANQSTYVNPANGPGIYISTLGASAASLPINMSAHTVNLLNTTFGSGSAVNLSSFYTINTGGGSVPGYVNFNNDTTYGGNPAPGQTPPPGSPGGGPGIHINSLH